MIGRGRSEPNTGSGIVLCPVCLMPDNGERRIAMNVAPLLKHGPLAHERHEQINSVSYNYKCPDCGCMLNYPRRLG